MPPAQAEKDKGVGSPTGPSSQSYHSWASTVPARCSQGGRCASVTSPHLRTHRTSPNLLRTHRPEYGTAGPTVGRAEDGARRAARAAAQEQLHAHEGPHQEAGEEARLAIP